MKRVLGGQTRQDRISRGKKKKGFSGEGKSTSKFVRFGYFLILCRNNGIIPLFLLMLNDYCGNTTTKITIMIIIRWGWTPVTGVQAEPGVGSKAWKQILPGRLSDSGETFIMMLMMILTMMMMMMVMMVMIIQKPEKVRHREKLGISTREIDSRNPQVVNSAIINLDNDNYQQNFQSLLWKL